VWDDSQLAFGECQRALQDSGDSKSLSKAKKALETILEGINKYPSVELRWRMSGQGKAQFEAMLKDVKDKMRKKSSSGGSGGSGGMR
jgi:hypothetical protein